MPIRVEDIKPPVPEKKEKYTTSTSYIINFFRNNNGLAFTPKELAKELTEYSERSYTYTPHGIVMLIRKIQKLCEDLGFPCPLKSKLGWNEDDGNVEYFYWEGVVGQKNKREHKKERSNIEKEIESRLRKLFEGKNIEFSVADWIRKNYNLPCWSDHYTFAYSLFNRMRQSGEIKVKFLRKEGRKTFYLINPTEMEEIKTEKRIGRRPRADKNKILNYIKSKQHTFEEIQEEFDLNKKQVYYWLAQAGLTVRDLPKKKIKKRIPENVIIEEWVDEEDEDVWE